MDIMDIMDIMDTITKLMDIIDTYLTECVMVRVRAIDAMELMGYGQDWVGVILRLHWRLVNYYLI